MRGELLPVWAETWRDIWSKLAKHPDAPEELFSEFYRAWRQIPTPPVEPLLSGDLDPDGYLVRPEDLYARQEYENTLVDYGRERALYEETIADSARAQSIFRSMLPSLAKSEPEAVSMLERSFKIVEQFGKDNFSNRYFELVDAFLGKFSLRYDLRRPFTLHPTLSGVFAQMISELRVVAKGNAHIQNLLREFEESFRNLTADQTPGQIKSCLNKQFILLEGLGQQCPGVTADTLGAICGELQTWPHPTLKEAAKKLYGFRSGYPGIGHAGNPASVVREIEMRDLVAVSVLIAGFIPYLSHQVDSNIIYRGSREA